ncbi:hypothetical protein [Hippea alviniae]|uniref:hypothetical protein n=1 Tax=Hippea alviniae TaxID=1279027 RepID=UPI0003B3DC9D|nr:hypothetical protein [Hippea alviniae]
MEKDELLLDPKWISSFYALVATAVCTLIFTYKGVDFFEAFIKTFFTVISFYLFGVATAAVVNYFSLMFRKEEEHEQEQEEESQQEEGESESEETESQKEQKEATEGA